MVGYFVIMILLTLTKTFGDNHLNTITTHSFATIEEENYKRDEMTDKQKARMLIAMGYENIEDPDIIVTTTEVSDV